MVQWLAHWTSKNTHLRDGKFCVYLRIKLEHSKKCQHHGRLHWDLDSDFKWRLGLLCPRVSSISKIPAPSRRQSFCFRLGDAHVTYYPCEPVAEHLLASVSLSGKGCDWTHRPLVEIQCLSGLIASAWSQTWCRLAIVQFALIVDVIHWCFIWKLACFMNTEWAPKQL